MTEKDVIKARKREKRFRFFLTASLVAYVLALGMFFLALQPGGIPGGANVGLVFLGIGALLSGMAGINAHYFWGVAESVVVSKESREKLLELCEKLE